jgi:hypothetical protein
MDEEAAESDSSVSFELETEEPSPCLNTQSRSQDPLDPNPPECPVCTDALWDAVHLPPCLHTFCRHCINEVIRHCESNDVRCPICRETVPEASRWLSHEPGDAIISAWLQRHWPAIWQRRCEEAERRAQGRFSISIEAQSVCAPGSDVVRWELQVSLPAPQLQSAMPMLIECVRLAVPGEEDAEQIDFMPFKASRTMTAQGGSLVVALQIVWKKRLGLPPLDLLQCFDRAPRTQHASQHEVSLPPGLTLARVLERSRPLARVGVGSSRETQIF